MASEKSIKGKSKKKPKKPHKPKKKLKIRIHDNLIVREAQGIWKDKKMATWRVNNSTTLGNFVCDQWVANTAYALEDRVVCRTAYGTVAARGYVYECTTAGTSHATTEPTWPVIAGNTVVDNGATWTCRIPNDGDWDNASCILHYVLNNGPGITAGDTVYVDDGHNENEWYAAANMSIVGSTTPGNPIKVICVDKADDSLSVGAIIQNSQATNLGLGGYLYCYGIQFYNSVYRITVNAAAGLIVLESDGSTVLRIAASQRIYLGAANYFGDFIIINGDVQFDGSASVFYPTGQGNRFVWKGGAVIDGSGNGVANLIENSGISPCLIEDVDLSGVGDGANARALIDVGGSLPYHTVIFNRCKFPSDAGFTVTTGTWASPKRGKVICHHCSSANACYDFYEESYEGNVSDETTIVRTGGASDGTTPHAFKMVSSANTLEAYNALESPPITIWNSAASEKTFTVECVWDSATNIQDDEIWMELEYPADDSSGLGAVGKDRCAILGTPADQAASTATWSGTDGFSDENKFKLSVTATPGKAGPVTAKIYLAKASTTVYVDPLITIS